MKIRTQLFVLVALTALFVLALIGIRRAHAATIAASNKSGAAMAEPAATCAPTPSGMISWWPADGNAHDIQDSNDGTLENGAAFGAGEVNEAFSLDSSQSQYVDVGSVNLPSTFTIDAWIYPTDFSSQPMIVNKDDGTTRSYYFEIGANGQFGSEVISGAGDTQYLSVDGAVLVNTWQHVAMTYDGSAGPDQKIKFYVNGNLVSASHFGSNDSGGTPNATALSTKFGINGDAANYRFNGLIDEVEFFNTVLTQTQIADIYNAGSAGKCRSCASAPGNMIAWWKAEGDATDSVDSHDGTINDATFATGKVGQAFSFDGVDDDVQIPDSSDWNFGTGDFTFDFWAKSSSTDRMYALSWDPVQDTKNLEFNFNDAGVGLWVYWNGGGGPLGTNAIQVGSSGQYTDGQWHHFALTRSGSTWTLYIDGDVAGTAADSEALDLSGGNNNYLGAYLGSNFFWNGQIDEVEVFKRALSADEVRALADAGSAGKCPCDPPPNSMVSWWPGDGNAFDFQDGNNGTTHGGLTYDSGEVAQAFSFNGSDSYVSFGNSVGNFGTSDFTVDFWMQSSSTRDEELIGKRTVCDNASFWAARLGHNGATQGVILVELDQDSSGTNYNFLYSTKTVNDGNFHHIAVVRSGVSLSLYIDGALDGTSNGPGVANISNTADLIAGQGPCASSGSNYFTGLLDEIEVFNRALNSNEIAGIYQAGGAGKCKPQGTPTPTPTATPDRKSVV